MIKLQKSKLTITSQVSVKSTQSRKYYERSIEFEDLVFEKANLKCTVQLAAQEQKKLENFLEDYKCEEYYVEVPSGKLFFTTRRNELATNGSILFNIFKEEKISYPEKQKV